MGKTWRKNRRDWDDDSNDDEFRRRREENKNRRNKAKTRRDFEKDETVFETIQRGYFK